VSRKLAFLTVFWYNRVLLKPDNTCGDEYSSYIIRQTKGGTPIDMKINA
jgi:hypothetical protein